MFCIDLMQVETVLLTSYACYDIIRIDVLLSISSFHLAITRVTYIHILLNYNTKFSY